VYSIEPFPHIGAGFLKNGAGERGEGIVAVVAMAYFHTVGIMVDIEGFTTMRAF
jgi:hypothetical protein